MPIKGMTDRGLAFPQIGVIRKGSPKQKKQNADGTEYEIQGKDLKYFRVEFDEAETEVKARFHELYKNEPTELRVAFPFNEVERVWDAWLEAYTASRLIARADGERILYWRDGKNIIVKNGLATMDYTAKIYKRIEGKHTEPLEVPLKIDRPVPFIDGMVFHRTEKTIVEAKPVGRLRVTMYELQRLGYLLLSTTSMNDIISLGGPDSGELGAIRAFCNSLGLPFAGVPLILRRKPKSISYTDANGKTSRMTRWLVHLEADPEYVKLAMQKSRELAMPAVSLLNSGNAEVRGVNEPEYIEEEDDIPAGDPSEAIDGVEVPAAAEKPEPEEQKYKFNDGMIVVTFANAMGLTKEEAAQALFEAHKKNTIGDLVTVTQIKKLAASLN